MGWPEAAHAAWLCADPQAKAELTLALAQPEQILLQATPLATQPGRPQQPELIHPAKVPRRKLGSVRGRIALIHAVAHIEFNAINLALDAALRFAHMPLAYYQDWISVARDEARHFQMLQQRLQQLDAAYGDSPAHNGLWEMADKTAHDPLLRMALVPRVLEARGLDVTPGMIKRLQAVGDEPTVACLQTILAEEIRHVAIGSRWFRHLCEQRQIAPGETFVAILREHLPARKIAGELNELARLEAGFSPEEMLALKTAI